jgi:hypothetical protein
MWWDGSPKPLSRRATAKTLDTAGPAPQGGAPAYNAADNRTLLNQVGAFGTRLNFCARVLQSNLAMTEPGAGL